jgi:hypothetical protein
MRPAKTKPTELLLKLFTRRRNEEKRKKLN